MTFSATYVFHSFMICKYQPTNINIVQVLLKKTIPFDYQFIIFLKGFIYSPTRDTQLIPNHTPLWINQTDADKSTVGYNLNY